VSTAVEVDALSWEHLPPDYAPTTISIGQLSRICVPPIIYLVRDAVSVGFHLPHDSFFHRPPLTVTALCSAS